MSNGDRPGPLISVIIPVFNNAFYTRLCLQALRAGRAAEPPFEIIVVDNASSDDTPKVLRDFEGEIAVVARNDTNLGFAVACNQGARRATGRFLLFLNNDVVLEAGGLRSLVGVAEADPTIGAVGARLLYPDGTIQHAGIRFGPDAVPHHAYAGYPGSWEEALVAREYQAVTGACLLIEKARFCRVGAFDEGYLNSFEDIDLCFKIRREGGRIVYCPDAVGYHFESATPGRFFRDDRNSRRFRERWSSEIQIDDDSDPARGPGVVGPASLMRIESDTLRQRSASLRAENEHLRRQLADQFPLAVQVFRLEGCSQEYCENLDLIYRPAAVSVMTAAERRSVPVSLVNCGRRAWPSGRLQLSYHWYHEGETEPVYWEGERTIVEAPLAAGSAVAVSAAVRAPTEPGDYVLEWDALEEGVAWLSQRGVAAYQQHLSIVPPSNGVVEIEGLDTVLRPGDAREIAATFQNGDGGTGEPRTLGWSWLSAGATGPIDGVEYRELPTGPRSEHGRAARLRFAVRAPDAGGSFRLQIAERHPSGAWLAVETVGGEVMVQGDAMAGPALDGTKPEPPSSVEGMGRSGCAERRQAMDDVAYFRRRLRRYAFLGREHGLALEEELAGERQSSRILIRQLDGERGRADRLEGQLAFERARADRFEGELAGLRTRAGRLESELAAERGRAGRLDRELDGERQRGRALVEELAAARESARNARQELERERETARRIDQRLEDERARAAALAEELNAARRETSTLADVVRAYQRGRLMRALAAARRARSIVLGKK